MEKIEQNPPRKMMEGPGPRSHTSYNKDQGQPTLTAPHTKDCKYGPPPARGSSPACRLYAKNCQYGPPPQHLADRQQKTRKPKGQTTQRSQKRRGTGRTRSQELGQHQGWVGKSKSIQRREPPAAGASGKGSVQRWEIPAEKEGRRPRAKAANASPVLEGTPRWIQ